jgi:hypothetical protein
MHHACAQTASDFVGQHVGESQTKTRAIIEMAQGKVLLIDEAYVWPIAPEQCTSLPPSLPPTFSLRCVRVVGCGVQVRTGRQHVRQASP